MFNDPGVDPKASTTTSDMKVEKDLARKGRFHRAPTEMAASSTNAISNLKDVDRGKSKTNVEGKMSYLLYCDQTSHSFIKGNLPSSRDNVRIQKSLFRPKLHIIVAYNDQTSLSMV